MNTNSGFPLNIQILNVATNMGRIGGWVADSYDSKRKLIFRFLDETEVFVNDFAENKIPEEFEPTFERFKKEFAKLKSEKITEKNKLEWAERALTWANILQHRSKLA